MKHKQEILEELAEYDKQKGFDPASFCSPPKRLMGKEKPRHPAEKSEKLPPECRNKHYQSYWQICADLGCIRYKNSMAKQSQLNVSVRKKK